MQRGCLANLWLELNSIDFSTPWGLKDVPPQLRLFIKANLFCSKDFSTISNIYFLFTKYVKYLHILEVLGYMLYYIREGCNARFILKSLRYY